MPAKKRTQISKKPRGAQLKDLKPKNNPKGGAINRIEVRYPS